MNKVMRIMINLHPISTYVKIPSDSGFLYEINKLNLQQLSQGEGVRKIRVPASMENTLQTNTAIT